MLIFIDCILLLLLLCITYIFAVLLYPITSLIKFIFYKNKTTILEKQFKELVYSLELKTLTLKRDGNETYIDVLNQGPESQILITDQNLKEHLSLSLEYSLGFDELARKQSFLIQSNYKEQEINHVINTIRLFILNNHHLQGMDMILIHFNRKSTVHYTGSLLQQYLNIYKRTLSARDYVPYFVLDWTKEKDDE